MQSKINATMRIVSSHLREDDETLVVFAEVIPHRPVQKITLNFILPQKDEPEALTPKED